MRYERSDREWSVIKPMLPNKTRGVRRVNDRRVLNGIFWVLRSGAPCATCQRPMVPVPLVTIASFVGERAGVWDQITGALAAGHDVAVRMIDTSVVRVHQHGACIADNNHQDMGRSRGGLQSVRVRVVAVAIVLGGALLFLAKQFADVAVGKMAGPLLDKLSELLGISLPLLL